MTAYNENFIVTTSNNKFNVAESITDKDGFIQNNIPPGAYEIKILNNEKTKNFIEDGHFTQATYPFIIKPNF